MSWPEKKYTEKEKKEWAHYGFSERFGKHPPTLMELKEHHYGEDEE